MYHRDNYSQKYYVAELDKNSVMNILRFFLNRTDLKAKCQAVLDKDFAFNSGGQWFYNSSLIINVCLTQPNIPYISPILF